MNLDGLIKDLRSSKLIAQCPKCDQEFKLADCLLFDGTLKFPTPAEKVRLQLFQAFEERKKQLEKRKISADVTAEKKAIEVGFGKIIEKFIPAYKNLKLQFCECRPLYDPIDLLVFSGLLKRNIDSITFMEIKSGNSRLNKHQKLVKDAVLENRVNMKVIK
jgi:predicted Holliday junction resolvase-like endonuclease